MAMKKDIKTWAIKIRGRSFYLRSNGSPWTFANKEDADDFSQSVSDRYEILAESVRVRVKVEEV